MLLFSINGSFGTQSLEEIGPPPFALAGHWDPARGPGVEGQWRADVQRLGLKPCEVESLWAFLWDVGGFGSVFLEKGGRDQLGLNTGAF